MSKFIVASAALAIAGAWAVSADAAEPGQKLDKQGRVARQVEGDGTQVVQTYARSGALVKRETSRGERVHFDKKGRAEAQSPAPSQKR
jgi:YD repeat-containing protein